MGKTTKRVLSMVLTVLMLLSMVTVFTLPASAESSDAAPGLDYDALFKNEETFLINPEWADVSGLKAGDTVFFWFRGEERTVKYNPEKHFASYTAAYNAIWSKLTIENYFTYKPVIIFAPGEYDEAIPVHAPATILGAQAGVSPNATIAPENWNNESTQGTWPKNGKRTDANETLFYQSVYFSTRTKGADGAWTNEVIVGEDAKWHYIRENACNANADKSLDYVVDGIKSEAGEMFAFSGADANKEVSYNDGSIKIVGGRTVNLYADNIFFTGANQLVGAWNTNNDYYSATFNNLRSTGKASNFVQRYFDHFKATNSYITGWSGSLTNTLVSYTKHDNASFTLEHCILAKGPSGNTAVFTGTAAKTGFTLNLIDNLMYNVAGATYGIFRIDCKSEIDVTLNLLNNEIYHHTKETYFNGNPDYVTAGRYFINFNGNKVISSTLKNVAPNASYTAEKAGSILYYNFDGNFFSDSVDGAGKPITFVLGPIDGAPLASGWDYTDTNYYFDYDMTYSSHGMKIAEAVFTDDALVEVGKNTIDVRYFRKEGVITPQFFADEKASGSVKAEFEMATDPAFENKITEIDLSTLGDSTKFYVRGIYKDTEYAPRVYTVNLISAEPKDFNAEFLANGIKVGDDELSYDNTAVFVKETEEDEDGNQVSYGFFNGTYYKFKVDNSVVFSNIKTLTSQMSAVEDPFVILPAGEYGDIVLPFAATYLGANALVDPVIASISDTKDGSDWIIGKGWGDYGETIINSANVADGSEGKLVLKGITIGSQFNDTLRTYGKNGKKYGKLDITLENVVLDQSYSTGKSNPVTKEIQNEGYSGCNGAVYAINLMNRRSVNFDELQPENGRDVAYPGFGETYNDSFTLKNFWVKDSSATARFINEFVPAHVTLDNVYRDVKASHGLADDSTTSYDNILGWLKTGPLNKNNSFTMVNCNFRNATEANSNHPFIGLEGASGVPEEKKAALSKLIADDTKYDVNISNNIFVNACRDTYAAENSEQNPYILLSPAYMTSVKINNNFVLNEDKPAVYFIANTSKHAAGLADKNAPIRGNIEIKGNSLIGFGAKNVVESFGLGADEPMLEDTFYTRDKVNYLHGKVGVYDESMGKVPYYWLDFARTKKSNDYQIKSITAKIDGISDITFDNIAYSIGADFKAGKLSDLDIELPEGCEGKWFEEIEGADVEIEDKAFEDMNSVSIFKYVVQNEADGISNTYKVTIYTKNLNYFDKEFKANAYFDNKAVIVSQSAKGLATGSIVTEEWYDAEAGADVSYDFVVGINAFATIRDAVAAAKEGTTPSILVPAGYVDATKDLEVYGPAKIFAPGYDIEPVRNDGFGIASLSNGDDWTFNQAFVSKQLEVKDIVVKAEAKGDIELYGFTVTGRYIDSERLAENNANVTLENTLFTGDSITSTNSPALFEFSKGNENIKTADNTSSFTVKNAYIDIKKQTAGEVRFIGNLEDLAPSAVTFDTIYLDLADSGIKVTNQSGLLKSFASNSSFTIKNSCIKNLNASKNQTFISFEGYVDDAANLGTTCGVWAPGRSNEIVYENNIFANFTTRGGDVSTLLDIKSPYSYTDVTVKNNYISGVEGQTVQLYRISDNGASAGGFKPTYTVTGNVINGFGDTKYEVVVGEATPDNFNWIIKDNFVTKLPVANVFSDGLEIHVPEYNAGNMQDGANLEYSHRLDVNGLKSTKQIYDMTYVGGIDISGNTLTVSLPVNTGVINSIDNTVTLANIIKENKDHNILRVKASDGYHDAREAVAIEDGLVFEVRSADGKSEIKAYNVVLNVVPTAQAFKDTFVDATPIVNDAGVAEPILNTAIMVSDAFTGLTGFVNAEWSGESYSFEMGKNAFATVKDALDFAKKNNLSNVQILFKNESGKAISFGITYPAKIYTENYNTMPYVTDGYGSKSPSHGEGWSDNPAYAENDTKVDVVWIDTGFTGKVEINGITLTNTFVDIYRTAGNTADVIFRNTVIDAVNLTSQNEGALQKITGIGNPGGDKGHNTYQLFRTGNASNITDAGNRLVFENMYLKYTANKSTFAQYLPQYTEFDGLYAKDIDSINLATSAINLRQQVTESTLVFENCNFQKFNRAKASGTGIIMAITGTTGTSNASVTDTQTLIADNNIFNSLEMVTANKIGYVFGLQMYSFKKIDVTNNYIASPYNRAGETNVELFFIQDSAANAAKIETDITISGNVFNSDTKVNIDKGTNFTLNVADNYKVPYDADVIEKNPVGQPMTVVNEGATVGTYYLDYDLTIKSNEIVLPTFAPIDNIIVEDELISYIADDKFAENEGMLSGNIEHIIDSHPYGDVTLVVDGDEMPLDSDIENAGSVKIKVYSNDKTNSTELDVQIIETHDHEFVDYVFNNDSTCEKDGTETAFCTGACGDENCTARYTRVKENSKAEHKYNTGRGVANNDATCETNGTVKYLCYVCNEYVDIEVENSTVDHVYENYEFYEAAICTRGGLEKGFCKWCGEEGIRENATKYPYNKKNHKFGEWVYNNDATCAKDGTETRTCIGNCGTKETRTSTVYTMDKVEHVLGEFKYDGNATCVTDGTMTARCTVENCRHKVTVADPNFKANPALHVFGEYTSDNNATCCENGTQTAVCSVCGGKNTIELPNSAKGHAGSAGALTDVKSGKWYSNAIEYVVAHNYFSGVSDTEFGLNKNITRGMFVTILARIAGVDTSNAANKAAVTKFTDVKSGKYYTAAVAWANAKGVVAGTSATTFDPNANISRQELAVMLVNFAKSQNVALTDKVAAVTFADASGIAKWAKDEVALCQKAGIISGYTEGTAVNFKPKNTASRAEAAQMIYKFVTEFVVK